MIQGRGLSKVTIEQRDLRMPTKRRVRKGRASELPHNTQKLV